MPTPTLPAISDATALALSDTVDARTGIRHWKKGSTEGDTPPLFTRFQQLNQDMMELLGRVIGGACVKVDAGLNVGVYPCEYKIGATDKSFAGVASQALTPSATNYLYLDADQTLKISTSAWPGTDHFRIAKVTTNGSTVTALVNAQMHNYQIGVVNAWYSIPAAAGVDLNGNALKNVGELWPSSSTELTLASDTITPTRIMHSVDTQADAAADDLVTLTADAAKVGRLLILRCENAAHVVTIKSTGNIKLKNGNLILDDVEKFVLLQQHTATQWTALAWNFMSFGPLTQDIDANNKSLDNVGWLGLKSAVSIALVSDELTPTASVVKVLPQSTFTDDLVTINAAPGDARILILTTDTNIGEAFIINVYDTDNIRLLRAGTPFQLVNGENFLVLLWDGTNWTQIAPGAVSMKDLVAAAPLVADQVIPYPIGPFFLAGTPTINVEGVQYDVRQPFRLRRASARTRGAPSGGALIIHVLKNGASIFAADTNAISIAAGAFVDVSDTVDVQFSTGDILSLKPTAVNGAVDITVGLDAWILPIASA